MNNTKRIGYWKGKKLSEETRRKLSIAHKGKIISNETKKRMSLSQKGKHSKGGWKLSLQTREKFRQIQLKIKIRLDKTPIIEKLRKCLKYRIWRDSVFKRDNWTCIWCGQKGGKLHADHIIPFSSIIEQIKFQYGIDKLEEQALDNKLLWDINNGRTLCVKCHKITPTYGFNKNKK